MRYRDDCESRRDRGGEDTGNPERRVDGARYGGRPVYLQFSLKGGGKQISSKHAPKRRGAILVPGRGKTPAALVNLQLRPFVGPRPELLEQSGDADQAIFGVPGADDLQPDRHVVVTPADRH